MYLESVAMLPQLYMFQKQVCSCLLYVIYLDICIYIYMYSR